jgi:Ino eighty subunit 1
MADHEDSPRAGREVSPSSGSTIADPDVSEMASKASTPAADPRNSLMHVLDSAPSPARDTPVATPARRSAPYEGDTNDDTEEELEEGGSDNKLDVLGSGSATRGVPGRKPKNAPSDASGAFSAVNKIKHLKKEDGIPLWRKDIQYEFLRAIFEDDTRVFTNIEDGTKGHTFADIYVDAMAKSKKTSKILRDKLSSDRPAALSMAMVCLLVNVGRMNTTLNCKSVAEKAD